ncbi:RdgB/HAM1 family non-canonical purine NTP pyrophosphatase [Coprothermobacteraceae bacterium]|nr:RdgB/HAM1 family non-canonical purine NTP pyrophosphatase [Coprothermobacteraceae bacterium]
MKKGKVVLATGNRGKMKEIQEILGGLVELVAYEGELPEETGSTYRENAYIKAWAAHKATGLPAVADDSGLEVDALGGRPGIHSSRFMGLTTDQERCKKLLELLEGVPWEQRTARFRCVVCFVDQSGEATFFEGTVEGYVALQPKGDNGFGYDPVFYYPPLDKHFAELPADVKNNCSHRAIAFRKLKEFLADRREFA